MKWKENLIEECLKLGAGGELTAEVLNKIQDRQCGIHIAIFVEPYIELVFSGEKTIESRFSMNQIAPFGKISEGDIVFVKRSGGDVEGYFIAKSVLFFSNLKPSRHIELEGLYGKKICTHVDSNFWADRQQARFLTLVEITSVTPVKGFSLSKNDRLSWIVVRQYINNDLFSN